MLYLRRPRPAGGDVTVQELRDLLNAYRDETILIQEGRKEFEYWPVALGEAQAALSGAIIAALPALLDIADAAKELCDPDGIIRLMRGDSDGLQGTCSSSGCYQEIGGDGL